MPLVLCAVISFSAFDSELRDSQQRHLDGLIRDFGMTLAGRLTSAGDVLNAIVTQPALSNYDAAAKARKFEWVRNVRLVSRVDDSGDVWVPTAPNPGQRAALDGGRSVILLAFDGNVDATVYLVHAMPGGDLLYAEFDPNWLWADADEFADGAALLVLDAQGRRITFGGTVPKSLAKSAFPVDLQLSRLTGPDDAFISRSWELFLAGGFASPSWRIVGVYQRQSLFSGPHHAYLYLCAVVVLTLLVITWFSLHAIRRQLRPLELLTKATQRLAQRDFDAFDGMRWNDEFGDLAVAFGSMSQQLKLQFKALETLSGVDRIMLQAPELESVLDVLLPRIAGVLRCESVSVVLFDTDSSEHARAYEYYVTEPGQRPVRRLTADIDSLRRACARSSSLVIDAPDVAPLMLCEHLGTTPMAAVRMLPLRHGDDYDGLLCLGYRSKELVTEDVGVGAADFADRLSLILANLKHAEKLRLQANFDSLTGLQNRHLFSQSVDIALAGLAGSRAIGALLYLDLDHFKRVNDTAGHAAGDGLLRIVAERLLASTDEGHSIARLGGDEFAVLLPRIFEPDAARGVAERILVSLQKPVVVDGREHHVSASIGMTVFPVDGKNLEELLKAGDIAMYQAKDAGRGQAVFFQAEMQQRLLDRLQLESGLHRALAQNGFTLHYQPIVSDDGGKLGLEALVRWPNSDHLPWIPPATFVPLAEENGLIVPLGDWILRTACRQFAEWRHTGLRLDYVSVNVSVRQLTESGYMPALAATMREFEMRSGELQIEITESVLAHGHDVERVLNAMVAAGVRLALDDFGTGYSSLSYLRNYPIHTVKIDRSFVMGLPQDVGACRLAESIIVMCAALGKHVVAEGVETEAQRLFLRRAGCTTIQGYLIGRPMEAVDVPGFARRLRSGSQPMRLQDVVTPSGHTAHRA